MRVATRDMGVVEVRPEQVVEFVVPLLGFEAYRKFAIIPVPQAPPFHLLQSLEERCLAFPLVRAEVLHTSYRSGPKVLQPLGVESWDRVECWIIVAIPPDGGPLRPNLAAPVVVDPDTRRAAQIIVQDPAPPS